MPLAELIITKSLTKLPSAYSDPKNHPHVSVAIDMANEGRNIHAGLEIPFVICKQSKNSGADVISVTKVISDRAWHPEKVKYQNLKVYFLTPPDDVSSWIMSGI